MRAAMRHSLAPAHAREARAFDMKSLRRLVKERLAVG